MLPSAAGPFARLGRIPATLWQGGEGVQRVEGIEGEKCRDGWCLKPYRVFGLALLLGVLGVLAFAPFNQFWLLFPVLACLFQILVVAPGWRAAALVGAAFGVGFFLAGVSWVYVSLSVFGGMPWWAAGLATLLFCFYLSLFPAVAGGLFRAFLPKQVWARALWFAALWALLDGVRGALFSGFPWLALGYSQTPPSPLAGFAPVLGVYGIGFLLALASALCWWRLWGGLLAALLLVTGWGLQQRAWSEPYGQPLSVALVQGNVPQNLKWDPEVFAATLAHYQQLVEANPARLTVLPETALPVFLADLPTDYVNHLKALAQRQDGDILLGVPTHDGRGSYWNSAVSLGRSPMQVYSKSHLVPFGEFIPTGFGWFLKMADIPMSSFSRGILPAPPLALAGQQLGVNICYEDAFGRELLGPVAEAGILVNLSNTAWFGRSLAQAQHLQIARMRALETGRPMLRATNTGMTAVIGPDGRVAASLPPFTVGVLRAEVQPYRGLTPYVRYGDWGAALLVGLALMGVWFSRRLRSGVLPE